MSRYVKTFKDKGGDKNKNDKLVSISTKIEDLKNTELNALPVYHDR